MKLVRSFIVGIALGIIVYCLLHSLLSLALLLLGIGFLCMYWEKQNTVRKGEE